MTSARPVTFRAVRAEDAEDLAAIRVEAMRDSLERLGRFDPERARRRFLDSFVAADTQAIFADGERVGVFVLRRRADGLLLDHLYIRPANQNLGIGARVLREVCARADAIGVDVRLGALRGSAANRFYARHGFEWVGDSEFDNYYVRRPRTGF
jgi:GNAT superfamily N-acetyltransferase